MYYNDLKFKYSHQNYFKYEETIMYPIMKKSYMQQDTLIFPYSLLNLQKRNTDILGVFGTPEIHKFVLSKKFQDLIGSKKSLGLDIEKTCILDQELRTQKIKSLA